MRDDRHEVLKRVRAGLSTGRLPGARAVLEARPAPASVETGALVERFAREVELAGGTVYRAQSEGEGVECVIERLRAAGASEILAWAAGEMPLAGLGLALERAGMVRLDPALPREGQGRKARLAELERAQAGLTGAQAGLADTGSLALVSGAGRPRLASLLPPVHIALLSTRTIFPTLADYLAANPGVTREGSNLVFITGPSRTADIELTLTRGVHGPRQLEVVLLS